METEIRDRFIGLWEKYCPGAELPITFEIISECDEPDRRSPPGGWRCVICDLARVRNGVSLVLDSNSVTCSGGRFYMGFEEERSPDFRYFLSYGKPGVVAGERYKRTPELVDEICFRQRFLSAGGMCYRFKRWDRLDEGDNPDVVIFFARPEVLSAVFTLANFDRSAPNGVICPFGSGCSSIIHYPRLEAQGGNPRAVLGMFDPSARPCVPLDVLTIALPMKRFGQLIDYMEESFLVTGTWEGVKNRIERSGALHGSKTC